jgi:hypothetical protein
MKAWLIPFLFVQAAEHVDPVMVPDICGFVSVQVCVAAKSHIKVARIIHIRPSAITALANPPDSPPDCLRLYVGSRTIYIVGTYEDVAARVHKAQLEDTEHSCKDR